MTLNIQKTVHLLPITFDVAEIINSFLFIRKEEIIKKLKREICNQVKSKYYFSRIQNKECQINDHESTESWFVISRIYSIGYITCISGINCLHCGNYKYDEWSKKIIQNEKIQCICERV